MGEESPRCTGRSLVELTFEVSRCNGEEITLLSLSVAWQIRHSISKLWSNHILQLQNMETSPSVYYLNIVVTNGFICSTGVRWLRSPR